MPSGLQKAVERHEKWWLGKYIRRADCPNSKFKKVVKIETFGNPSFVYGSAELLFEDGTRAFACFTDVYRPRKKDWEVQEAVEQSVQTDETNLPKVYCICPPDTSTKPDGRCQRCSLPRL